MSDGNPFTLTAESNYGYWVSDIGTVLNVEQREGHVESLMDCNEFIDLSPTQPYRIWYEAAFIRGWVRIIAPAANRQQFRFQFGKLSPAARISLIGLINNLAPYREYIFESSTYEVFCSPQRAASFVEQHCGPVCAFSTVSWTTNHA